MSDEVETEVSIQDNMAWRRMGEMGAGKMDLSKHTQWERARMALLIILEVCVSPKKRAATGEKKSGGREKINCFPKGPV